MKALAHRDQDLLDIDALLAVHPAMDWRRIREWTRLMASALDAPEIYDDLDRRLRLHSRRRKGKQ